MPTLAGGMSVRSQTSRDCSMWQVRSMLTSAAGMAVKPATCGAIRGALSFHSDSDSWHCRRIMGLQYMSLNRFSRGPRVQKLVLATGTLPSSEFNRPLPRYHIGREIQCQPLPYGELHHSGQTRESRASLCLQASWRALPSNHPHSHQHQAHRQQLCHSQPDAPPTAVLSSLCIKHWDSS